MRGALRTVIMQTFRPVLLAGDLADVPVISAVSMSLLSAMAKRLLTKLALL